MLAFSLHQGAVVIMTNETNINMPPLSDEDYIQAGHLVGGIKTGFATRLAARINGRKPLALDRQIERIGMPVWERSHIGPKEVMSVPDTDTTPRTCPSLEKVSE